MRITLVTPAPRASRHGNRITARRWARILRDLGHRVLVAGSWDGGSADLLIALHARRSRRSVLRFAHHHPERPVIIALTGTDLHVDLPRTPDLRDVLRAAWRLVVLHERAPDALPAAFRERTRILYQSVAGRAGPSVRGTRSRRGTPSHRTFDVAVVAHLRPVKDPFRTAIASRSLPADSRVRIVQMGAAMSDAMARRARAESARNPRYLWLGDLPRWQALARLRRCRLAVNSSRAEGGANAVSEAIANGVPVVASRIPGNVGLLGAGHPGYFPAGDTQRLAALLRRAETSPDFLRRLQAVGEQRRALFDPARERREWRRLLAECSADRPSVRIGSRTAPVASPAPAVSGTATRRRH
ncbi:MAG: selenoneine biosynthesis selenosugar synthase SenB [Acidobacteriota bacterium]